MFSQAKVESTCLLLLVCQEAPNLTKFKDMENPACPGHEGESCLERAVVQGARMLCGTAVCGPPWFLMGYCPAMKQAGIFCGFVHDSSLETTIVCAAEICQQWP